MLRANSGRGRDGFWSAKLAEIRGRRRVASRGDPKRVGVLSAARRWERQAARELSRGLPEQGRAVENPSGIPLRPLYTPAELKGFDYLRSLGMPGEYPYTRGVHPTMYRGRLWTMRMFSGFGTPEDTNRRLKRLLEGGETGLSIAFDMPTLYGYDADHPRARGEVGRCGVNVSSLQDMEVIFAGLPLDRISTSMTINAPAAALTCMYIAAAGNRGIRQERLRGTTQTDILKEYIAQKEWAFPPEAHLRLIRDMIYYCTKHMPYWNHISVSGYHIREAGSNAVQELAFTLADGFAYVELGIEAGLRVDEFAPRLSFFFNCDMDFFEEVAKFRAARRIWATVLRERYRATDPRSLSLRFHTQTSGASLTWQQPLNNVVRTTIEALAAVLGGSQSLHTNAYDEAWALPTEESATTALRTQQIIAEESGIAHVIDPLGGSYYLESLTNQLEERAYRYLDEIESMGGVLQAIKSGYLQREIAETAYRRQQQLEKGERVIVGVNQYEVAEQQTIQTLKIDATAQKTQVQRLKTLKARRDGQQVNRTLLQLKETLKDPDANAMYPMLKAVKDYATLGEIMDVGREVFGEWREAPLF